MSNPRLRLRTAARRVALAFVTTVSLAACGESTTPRTPSVIDVTSGNNQVVTMGSTATLPLAVTILDQNGAALQGVSVTWTIVSGTGTLASSTSVTDSNGLATTTYTAGTDAGTVVISADVTGLTAATFNVTVQATDGGD